MTYLPQSQSQTVNPSRLARLTVAVITILIALLVAMGSYSHTVSAADTCSTTSCVLACNARLKVCSRFPNGQVPSGYVRVNFMPNGYRRVRQTKCDLMVCPSYVKDCRRWVPTQTQ